MITIYKYPLELTDSQIITIPRPSRIVSVQMQGDQLCLWAIVNTETEELRQCEIRIVGTGNPFPDASECEHIATVMQPPFVWHVFEKLDPIRQLAGAL